MFAHSLGALEAAERSASGGDVGLVLSILRQLSLMDFGEFLLTLPNDNYPAMSGILPRMATAEVQEAWTGASGRHLLTGSVDFVRMVEAGMSKYSRTPLRGAKVMDFGCGYGRLARLMYWYTDPTNYVGVDPWDQSIALVKADKLLGTFVQSDYAPTGFEVGGRKFDLIFAFSVFTHTSLRITKVALAAIRKYIANTGVLALTVRPIEFWNALDKLDPDERALQIEMHERTGFSFNAASFPRLGDELIFGNTTIDLDWFRSNLPDWSVEGYDRGLDQYQTCVFMTPR